MYTELMVCFSLVRPSPLVPEMFLLFARVRVCNDDGDDDGAMYVFMSSH